MTALVRAVWFTLRHDPTQPIDGDFYSRSEFWQIARPMWTHTILTTKAPCGCRKRFGLRHTIYCLDHVFGPLMARKS